MSHMAQNTLNNSWATAMIPLQIDKDVVLSRKIDASSSRVFYALSIPEYIEAWLRTPDADELQSVFNLVAQEAFRIDLYRAEAIYASVYGLCNIVNPNQVRYSWKTTSPVDTTETLVDMQLRRDSDACILGLKHTGFKNSADSAWCRKMWHHSLESLSNLMEKRQRWDTALTSSNRKLA